jgi:Dienelactone hydrolase and related enzymes
VPTPRGNGRREVIEVIMTDVQTSTFNVGPASYPIDRYVQSGSSKLPVVVILHGVDGMVGESETEIRKLAAQIAGDGYAVFLPHYFGAEPAGATTPPVEVLLQRTSTADNMRPRIAAAVKYSLAQPESDAGRLGLVGLSLGGGLALWFAESAPSGSVRAVVDFFGHISDPAIYAHANTLPPTLVFHNKPDGVVPSKTPVDLLAVLKQQGVVHDGTIYDKEPPYPERLEHTFRPGGPADVDSRARTRKWLDTYVKP